MSAYDNDSKKHKKPILHHGESKPITRRQLLARGAVSLSATALAPVFFSMVKARSATAGTAGCGSAGLDPTLIPFLVFDCNGGAALPGNFLVGKKGGPEDLLASYDTLGWNPRTEPLDRAFGVPMAKNVSQIFQGIIKAASPEAQAGLRMGTICNASQDDSSGNPLSALCLVMNAGYQGSVLSKGIGELNSDSGGNSQAVLGQATQKPVYIASVDDLKGAVSFGGQLATMKPAQLSALVSSALDLNGLLAPKYQTAGPNGKLLASLSQCAYAANKNLVQSPPAVDPRLDPIISKIFAIDSSTDTSDPNAVSAAVIMNALNGNSGPGVITINGCDYHTGDQATGDGVDLQIGTAIGQAVESAHQMKKPLFFQILTDGGISAAQGTRNWQSDSGDRGLMVLGYFNPISAPVMSHLQVGNYTDGQGVERGTFIGDNPSKAAFAAFANYLNICKKISLFESIAGQGTFSVDELDAVLMFS